MGKWKVAVHDNTRLYQPWEKPYFVLSQGDVYNMKTPQDREARDWSQRRAGGSRRAGRRTDAATARGVRWP